MTQYLSQVFIYLAASVIAVPFIHRLGLGSVLGYMIAGVVIGPLSGLVGSETSSIQHFAEFGIVMMLFLSGLELEPKLLWKLKSKLFGLGGLQIALTTLIISLIALAFHLPWQSSLAVGLIFSLSSTAIVLQTLNEKGWTKTEGGKNAFAVLLLQDIAVIPIFAILPLLALPNSSLNVSHLHELQTISLVNGISGWKYALVVVSAISAIIVGGHFLSRPLFNYVARTRLREIFTISALMVVIGIAVLMDVVGLSAALGTFLAGVVLADSEFRHALEATIEPFKGLLLGLFFITIGAGTNFALLKENFTIVFALTFGYILLKFLILMLLSFVFRIRNTNRWLFSLSLAQGGIFTFVLLNFSVEHGVVAETTAQILTLVVTGSMFLSPLLFVIYQFVVEPYFEKKLNPSRPNDVIKEEGNVIIAGGGRFGEVINRLLVQNGIKTIVIDSNVDIIESLRMFKMKSYFGDVMNLELLETAGIGNAKLLVLAIDNREIRLTLAKEIKREYPGLPIISRCYGTADFYELKKVGVDSKIPETFYSALELGGDALKILGFHPLKVEHLKQTYVDASLESHEELCSAWMNYSEGKQKDALNNYIDRFIEMENLMATMMSKDKFKNHSKHQEAWSPAPKEFYRNLEDK